MTQFKSIPRISAIIGFLLLLLPMLFLGGCANIVPPSGGPRDSIPPVLNVSTPALNATDVQTMRITLEFDEFIELKAPSEQILITPYPTQSPLIESKLRTVTVKLKDSLQPNTTYVIDFGNAIVDLNEGNVLKGYRHVFSTGKHIDSNTISGRVIIAETGQTDSTYFALLYRKNEDSTVAKEKPVYVTRLDAKGRFQFTHLPAGRFYVYALQDNDGNKQYNQPTESFAFLDTPVVSGITGNPVTLYAFTSEKEQKKTQPAVSSRPKFDNKGLPFATNLDNGTQDLLDSLKLTYQRPLKKLNKNEVFLFTDSITPVTDFFLKNDSAQSAITLFTTWKPNAVYRLILNQAYAQDVAGGAPLNNDTLQFRAKEEKEYGSIRIRFNNLDTAKHPVLLLFKNNAPIGAYPLRTNEWHQRLIHPGDYTARILYDENENGQWDAGDYFTKPRRQPERVQTILTPISIKANWDNELMVELQ